MKRNEERENGGGRASGRVSMCGVGFRFKRQEEAWRAGWCILQLLACDNLFTILGTEKKFFARTPLWYSHNDFSISIFNISFLYEN